MEIKKRIEVAAFYGTQQIAFLKKQAGNIDIPFEVLKFSDGSLRVTLDKDVRTEEEARQYSSAYNKRYNTAARAPECYTTHEGKGYVWVEMAKLELKVTELGIYCTLTS